MEVYNVSNAMVRYATEVVPFKGMWHLISRPFQSTVQSKKSPVNPVSYKYYPTMTVGLSIQLFAQLFLFL